jgi:hypothetical protein
MTKKCWWDSYRGDSAPGVGVALGGGVTLRRLELDALRRARKTFVISSITSGRTSVYGGGSDERQRKRELL